MQSKTSGYSTKKGKRGHLAAPASLRLYHVRNKKSILWRKKKMNQITIAKAWTNRNGELMFYINASNGVSFGVGKTVFTSKMTKGQNNAVSEMRTEFESLAEDFSGKFENHTEAKAQLAFGYQLFITDTATVCGINVGEDGAYLVRNGKIAKIR
ncbi:MAG: hypothetical protein LBS74_07965 [Oscillospiraceae bacterium]|jgi:hypothetical protein|nr:hypothetical protein [Oscillospiraceae bacterium]